MINSNGRDVQCNVVCLRLQSCEEEKGVYGKGVIEDKKEDDESQDGDESEDEGTKETRQKYPIKAAESPWGFHGHENVLGGTRIDVHQFQSE